MFKSTFDPKAVAKKHKEIERKFEAITESLTAASLKPVALQSIQEILRSEFSDQINESVHGKYIDAIGNTILEPENL